MATTETENRRLQCTQLRQEINQADQTCEQIMGFLITITGLAGAPTITSLLWLRRSQDRR